MTASVTAEGVLETVPGVGRSNQSVSVEFGPAVQAPVLRFDFGFSTLETVDPGEIPDAFTVTVQDAIPLVTLVLVTLDAGGAAWAPLTPGTTPIGQENLVWSSISYPNLGPKLTHQQAYTLEVSLPPNVVGRPLTVYFDLFNNDNGVPSQGWYSKVEAVPEPGSALLLTLGGGLGWWARRRSEKRSARESGLARLSWLWLLALLLLGGPLRALAQDKSFRLNNADLTLTQVSPEVEVNFRSMRFNRALQVWNVEVTVKNKSARQLTGPLLLLLDSFSGTTGAVGPDGQDEGEPAKAFFDLSAAAGDGALAPGEVTAARTLTLGQTGNDPPALVTEVYAGRRPVVASLGVTRSLDEAGRPLPGVALSVTGPAGTSEQTSDSPSGVASLGQGPGEHRVKFSANGYLPVWRRQTLVADQATILPNPRLTKRTALGFAVNPLGGMSISNAAGSIRIDLAAGAVNQNSTVTLTPLTGQNLPAFLPSGWSPLNAFWLECSSPLAGTLAAAFKPAGPINAAETAALVKWDESTLRWLVTQTLLGKGTNALNLILPGVGAYALVVGDIGLLAPPLAQPNQPLPAGPAVSPFVTGLSVTGIVTPPASPANVIPEFVTGTANLVVQHLGAPLPSGYLLRGEVTETYVLADGSLRLTPQYEHFIVGYQRPGDNDPTTLHAAFPMRPLLLFGPDQLDSATVRVDVLPEQPFDGQVLDAGGGQVGTEGVRILAGSGRLTAPSAFRLRRLDATVFTQLVGPSNRVVAAFDLTVDRSTLTDTLSAQLSGAPTNGLFVIARVLSETGFYGLQPVERVQSDAQGNLSSLEPASGDRLPGLRGSGQFVLLQIGELQGLISGIARNGRGEPEPNLPVRLLGLPWLTLADSQSRFQLISPAGSFQLSVTDPRTGDSGVVELTVTDPRTPLTQDLSTAPRGPRVARISPADQATRVARVRSVVVEFNEAIHPATVIDAIQILKPDDQVVPAALTLNLANRIATLSPATELAANTLYRVRLRATIADPTGLPLEGPNEFTFRTVPLSTRDPAAQLIIYEPGATNVPAAVLEGIPAYEPGEDAFAIVVRGTPGVADPEVPVILVNESTGETSTVLSKVDGSFTSVISGTEDDFVSATFVNLNGTRIYVSVSRQEFDNGFVGLYPQGGILEAQSDGGPVKVLIEPSAIQSKTKLRLKVPSAAELQEVLGSTQPETARSLARPMILETDGQAMSGPIKVSFTVNLLAAGYPETADPFEAAVALVRVTDTEGDKAFEVLDQLKFTPSDTPAPAPLARVRPQGLPGLNKDGEQLFYGTVNSVIGLIPQAGIANTVFRYVLMPLLVGGKPIVVKGKVLTSLDVVKAENPLAIDNPLLGGFSYGQLGKAFGAIDQLNTALSQAEQLTTELTDLLLGRALGGAFVTLQNVGTPSVPGRLRPGMVYATSGRDGSFLLVAPTTPLLQLLPNDFYLVMATHPRYQEKLSETLFALTDLSIAGVAFKNFVFREPIPLQSSPQINVAHSPPYPAAGETVELQVNASQGFQGDPEINVYVAKVFPTNQSVTSVQITDEVSVPLDGNRTRWTGKVKAPAAVQGVLLQVSARSSAGVFQPRIPYPINFIGEPNRVEGPIPPSDPNEKRGPSVVATFPDEDGFVTDTGEITVVFNEPIDRSVETNVAGILLSGPAAAAVPAVRLSSDQTTLTLQYGGLLPDEKYTVTLTGESVVDLTGNPLDQRPSTEAADSFSLNLRTTPVARFNLPGVVNGTGAALHGARLYVIDNAPTPMLRTYDVSIPEAPSLLGSVRVVGAPRDLVVIPNYSYKLNLHDEPRTNDLVAVVGGYLDTIIDDLDSVIVSGQYLRVFEMGDPANPVEIASPVVSYRAASAVTKVRWHAPNLVYQEFGADLHQLVFVDLQEHLIGRHAVGIQVDSFPPGGKPGIDANGDGDYVDPGDVMPLPQRRPPEFYGKKQSYVIAGSTQKVLDFSVSGGTIGVTLSGGVLLSQNGTATSTTIRPQYRTLSFNGFEVDPGNGSVNFDFRDYPGRVTVIDGLSIEVAGELKTPVVALVSLSPDHNGKHKLLALDITFPETPKRIGEVTLPEEMAGGGVKSVQLLKDGRLELTTVSHVVLLEPRYLARDTPPEGQLHPAVVGFIPHGGGRMRSVATSDFGVRAVVEGGRHEVVQSAPTLSFIHFPTAPLVVDPRLMSRAETNLLALMDLSRPAFGLVPARVRPNHLGQISDLLPANPAVHFHVLMEAPGGAGREVRLGLEALSYAGWPLPNKGAGFPPVRAVEEVTLNAMGIKLREECDAPVRSLAAYRMSDDPASLFYNQYLSRPFVVVYESMSLADLESRKIEADREILWSGATMRAFIEPNELRNGPIKRFAAQVDTDRNVIRPLAAGSAATLDVSYIMGPNPPPPSGDEALDGTYGSISAHNGEFRTEATDLTLPSPRMPIEIERTIGGQDTYDGPFGLGWDFNYNQRLTELQPQLFPEGFKMPLIARGELVDSVIGNSKDLLFHTGQGRIVLFRWVDEVMPPEYAKDPLVAALNYGEVVADYYLPEAGVFDLLVKFKDGKYERLTPEGTRFKYAANGRLETIIDRFPANRHELEYDRKGWLRRLDDRSVTAERFVEFGYYRRASDPEFGTGLDEQTTNPYLLGKICRLRDYAGRDLLYFYNDEALLIRREGIEVAGENGGFAGRNQTHYLYEKCRIVGVAVGVNKTPLMAAATEPGTQGVPVAKAGTGTGLSIQVNVPLNNAADKLENQKTTTQQGDGRQTEIIVDKFGQPKTTTISGAGTEPAELQQEHNDDGLVTMIKYPEGRVHRMTYDTSNPVFRSRGNLVSLRVEAGPRGGEGYTETYSFDPFYNLPSGGHTDANGFTITYALSADRRFVRSIQHGEAGSEVFEYNLRGQLESRVDYDGLETGNRFDSATGFLERSTKGPHATTYEYGGVAGELGQATSIQPPRGAALAVKFNRHLQQVEVKREESLQQLAYDEQGREVYRREVVGDGKQRETRLDVDVKGFISRRRVSGIEVAGSETTLEYNYTPDALSRVKSIVHPGGSIQTFEYNALGHPTKMALETYVEEYTPDRHGNVVAVKKGGDAVSTSAYDGLDRPKGVTILTGTRNYLAESTYFPAGQLKTQKVTDPAFGVLQDRVVSKIDALGRILESTLNGDTVSFSETTEHGVFRRTTVGPRQTVTSKWNSAGYSSEQGDSIQTSSITTDGNGNTERIVRAEDGASYADITTYNELDHPKTVSDNFGLLAEFSPRADGQNTEVKNARNNVTRMEHSALGEVLRRRRADGMEFRFRHDEQRQGSYSGDPTAGFESNFDQLFRLTRRTQRNGAEITTDSFDPRNQPKTFTFPGGKKTMAYDLQSRVTSSSVEFGPTVYETSIDHDALNRARVVHYEQTGSNANRAVHEYDKAGPHLSSTFVEDGVDLTVRYAYRNDLTRNRVTYPSGFVVNEERDGAGRLTGISGTIESIATVTAWQGNQQPQITDFGGVLRRVNRYDARGRLTGSRYSRIQGGARQAELRYQYDAANNLEMRQFVHRAGKTDNFSYDNGERLSRAQVGGVLLEDGTDLVRLSYQRSYNYEATGLDYLLTAPTTGAGAIEAPFAASWSNHDAFLLPGSVNGVSRGASDSLGRVKQAQVWTRPATGNAPIPAVATFQHNGLGQLVRIEREDGSVVENFFQPGGLRYARKISQGGSVLEYRHFVYDQAGRLLEEFDRTGASPVVIGRYFYLDSDAPCAADLPDATGALRRHYLIQDDQYSVVAVTDRFGVVEERVWYDPFGQPVIEPRDEVAPVIKRVLGGEGGKLLIELSEPVTSIVPDLGPADGIRRLTQSFADLVSQPAGRTEFPEVVPGFAPSTVIIFNPEEPLTGAVEVTLRPGQLTDDWDNHVLAQTVTANITGDSGSVYFTANGTVDTDGGTAARSTVGSPFLFHGQYFDYATGLLYLRARFFDPFSGMFLEPDPMGYEDSVNLYAGIGNSPATKRDPSGLIQSWSDFNKKASVAKAAGPKWSKSAIEKIRRSQYLATAFYAHGGRPRKRKHDVDVDSIAHRQKLEKQSEDLVTGAKYVTAQGQFHKRVMLGLDTSLEGHTFQSPKTPVRQAAEKHEATHFMTGGNAYLPKVEHAAAGVLKGKTELIVNLHGFAGMDVEEKMNSSIIRGSRMHLDPSYSGDWKDYDQLRLKHAPDFYTNPKTHLIHRYGESKAWSATDTEMFELYRWGVLDRVRFVTGEHGEIDLVNPFKR